MSKRIWCCDNCGKEDTWGEGWAWYGSIKSYEDNNNTPDEVVCSDDCRVELAMVNHHSPKFLDDSKVKIKKKEVPT